ncbi:MAG: apolipoprotein N-acyltransferase [Melioribacteraceae bacterium]|nr:apolipoprotein N-acyltransferase [Melioribacteraceae bacterium]
MNLPKLNKKWIILLSVISGFMIGISYPPIPFPYLIFIAFVPYLYLLNNTDELIKRVRISYLAFFVFNLITIYWVGSWTKEADTFLMISGGLLLFVNPALYLIPVFLHHYALKTIGKKGALFLFPFFWVFFEYLFTLTDLRFPWLTLSNSITSFNSFIQIADIIGAYGLSLLILFINLFVYLLVIGYFEKGRINYRLITLIGILFLLPIVYGIIKNNYDYDSGDKIRVGLIQPNLNPWQKWSGGDLQEQIDLYLGLSQKAVDLGAKIIVFPESALPVYLLSGNYDFEVNQIHNFVNKNKVFLLTGMPDINFYFKGEEAPEDAKETKVSGAKYTSFNSILGFSPDSFEIQKYGKIKLVPFGEKVPFVEEIPLIGDLIKWQVGISSWNTGDSIKVFNYGKNKIGGVICIESIYPDFVAEFVQKGAGLITVVTNDSWYGYSSGPFQHKEINRLRAIENRKYVVMAANGGVSNIIDPNGNIISETKLFSKDILVGDIIFNYHKTFYTNFPLIIPNFVTGISIAIFILFLLKKFFQINLYKEDEKNN